MRYLKSGRVFLFGLFLVPLVWLPFTLDPRELNKQTFFIVLVFLAALLWVGGRLQAQKIEWKGGVWVWLLSAFCLSVTISGALSSYWFGSFLGGSGQEYTSVLTFVGLALMCGLIACESTSTRFHTLSGRLFLTSGFVVGGLALLERAGISVPQPVGSLTATTLFLLITALFGLSVWVYDHPSATRFWRSASLGIVVITWVVLVLFDYDLLWQLSVLGTGLILISWFFLPQASAVKRRLVLPFVCFLISLSFLFFPSPIRQSIPLEVTLNAQSSRALAQDSLRETNAWFGAGPGMYGSVFARYHTEALNETPFFDTRFDRASSFFWTLVPTIGWVGVSLLGALVLWVTLLTGRILVKSKNTAVWIGSAVWFPSWVVLLVAATQYHFTMTLVWLLFVLAGLLLMDTPGKIRTWTLHPTSKIVWTVFWTVSVFVLSFGTFVIAQRYIGEIAYSQAIRADRTGASTVQIVEWLNTAATTNQFDDRAYRVLAQALLVHLESALAQTDEAEMTEASKQQVQSLVAASVNAAVRATELSSHNSQNWALRGMVYRELIPVLPHASTFAIEAYEHAIVREPLSPILWTELGITYLAAAQQLQPQTLASVSDQAAQASILVGDYLVHAETALTKAIGLRPVYAPAHYQLSLVYDVQGRLDDAVGKLESVAKYNQEDVGVAFQLGQLYLKRRGEGDAARAQNALEHVTLLAPSFSQARWYLASVYEEQGQRDLALEQLEAVRALNPTNPIVLQRIERIQKGESTVDFGIGLP